ncbi:MAG: RNA polymerase sigma factor [Candidatus Doudnabacteria bacterium]|nr:RNA polymerase sigma factor [Candidatus Doudnabacteria bacterium]
MFKSQERQFLKAYDEYADSIYRHCYFRVFQKEQAQDLVQDTFTKTWEYLSKGNTIENIRAFLYRTATNLIVDQSRKPSELSLESAMEEGFEPQAVENIEVNVDTEILVNRLKDLEEPYREVIILKYIEGFKIKEIAEILDKSENIISVRLHRGAKKLKEILKEYE